VERLKRGLKAIKIAFKVMGGLRWHWKRNIFVVNFIYEKVSVRHRACPACFFLLYATGFIKEASGQQCYL